MAAIERELRWDQARGASSVSARARMDARRDALVVSAQSLDWTDVEPAAWRGDEAAYRQADERGDAGGAFAVGMLLAGQNRLAEAGEAFARADQRGHAAAAVHLGFLLEERHDVTGAEAAYRRADERGDVGGAFELAMLLTGQKRLAEAAEAFARADEGGHAAAAVNLGVLLERQGDVTGAEAAYQRAGQRGHPDAAARISRLREPPPARPDVSAPRHTASAEGGRGERAGSSMTRGRRPRRRAGLVAIGGAVAIAVGIALTTQSESPHRGSAATAKDAGSVSIVARKEEPSAPASAQKSHPRVTAPRKPARAKTSHRVSPPARRQATTRKPSTVKSAQVSSTPTSPPANTATATTPTYSAGRSESVVRPVTPVTSVKRVTPVTPVKPVTSSSGDGGGSGALTVKNSAPPPGTGNVSGGG